MRARRMQFWIGSVAGMVATVLVLGGLAFANDVFSDVPADSPYHDDVTWLAASGVTAGCGGGRYCPSDPVTREQIAALLHRLVGQTRTGRFVCAGEAWQPIDSDTTFIVTAADIMSRTSASGSRDFICNAVLPEGATITRVDWALHDTSDAGDMGACWFYQRRVTSGADVESTLVSEGQTVHGDEVIGGPVPDGVVVDNQTKYVLRCQLGPDTDSGVRGAVVTYTYDGVPAP